jgi:hypothetical protein
LEFDNYKCCWYNNFHLTHLKDRFPKLQFRIIDEKEIIFASKAYEGHLCSIIDEDLAGILKYYFLKAWENADDDITSLDAENRMVLFEKIEHNMNNIINNA